MRKYASLALLLAVWGADAATINRTQLQTAVSNCQGVSRSSEGSLRKRPLGMSNQGANTVYVTCALTANDQGSGTTEAGLRFTNTTDATVSVSCILVNNTVYSGSTNYTKSMQLAPKESNYLFWNSTSTGGANLENNINFNCSLPPGVDLNYTARSYMEESNP